MIEAIELEKSFGTVQAVRQVSLSVRRGEVVGLLGPNGAGKTTIFRMMAGTIGPSSGKVEIAGINLEADPAGAKSQLGYMPENAPLYPELTGIEYLGYRAELKRIPRKKRPSLVERASEQAGVEEMLGIRIGHLSKGFRQRLALADALLGAPPVLLLDEPTAGLDPNQVQEFRRLIRSLTPDHAIVISTHILSEVEALCSRAAILHEGRVVGEGSLNELRGSSTAASHGRIKARATKISLLECLSPLLEGKKEGLLVRSESNSDSFCEIELPLLNSGTLSQAIALCCQSGIEVLEAAPVKAALDEAFAQLTGNSKAKAKS